MAEMAELSSPRCGKGGKVASVRGRKLDLGPPTQTLRLGPAYDRSLYDIVTECSCGKAATEGEILSMMADAECPVVLNVYAVGYGEVLREMNNVVMNFIGDGGVFHAAVEVAGAEYSFGVCKTNRCGIFACAPKACPLHTYRESIFLGDCDRSESSVHDVLAAMKDEWMGPTYDILRKNCGYFADALSRNLGTGKIPPWVNHLAHVGAILDADSKTAIQDLHDIETAIDDDAGTVWEFTRGRYADPTASPRR